MVLWLRGLGALCAVVVLSSVAAAGCNGLSSDEATLRCQQEQMDIADCFDSSVLAACEACYESCGDSCTRVVTCPITYQCPGQSSTGGASSGSSGTQ
jgi:hypothetical protein